MDRQKLLLDRKRFQDPEDPYADITNQVMQERFGAVVADTFVEISSSGPKSHLILSIQSRKNNFVRVSYVELGSIRELALGFYKGRPVRWDKYYDEISEYEAEDRSAALEVFTSIKKCLKQDRLLQTDLVDFDENFEYYDYLRDFDELPEYQKGEDLIKSKENFLEIIMMDNYRYSVDRRKIWDRKKSSDILKTFFDTARWLKEEFDKWFVANKTNEKYTKLVSWPKHYIPFDHKRVIWSWQ